MKKRKPIIVWFVLTPQGFPIPYSCAPWKRTAIARAVRGTGRSTAKQLTNAGFTAAKFEIKPVRNKRK